MLCSRIGASRRQSWAAFDWASGLRGWLAYSIVAAAVFASWSTTSSSGAPPAHADSKPAIHAVDLRPVLDKWGLAARSQGPRPTCSAFVVTGALEYAMASVDGRGTRLSVEFLNWASNEACADAEDGGFFSDLWKGFQARGICPETDLPYRPKFDTELRPTEAAMRSARRTSAAGFRLQWIKPWDVTTGLTDTHLASIKQTLCRQWPVCSGLRWPKAERWNDGVLAMAPPEGVRDGHSVLLVGFRDDPAQPGGGVFLLRNSSNHARDGWMTYEYARAYMNDAAWIEPARPVAAGTADAGAATMTPAGPSSRSGRTSFANRGPSEIERLINPLGGAVAGRSRRVSSNQQPQWDSENLDMTWIQPGKSVEMPMLEGPGAINHMWFTSHAGWVGELNALSLRIYYDGNSEPGVCAPLGDFFAVGQGKPASVESIPVQVSRTGSLTCYWRMPFRTSAKIVVTNDNPDRSTGLYWQVDWVQTDRLPEDTPYFHANFRRAHPAGPGDYLIADLEGRGRYVGTVMSVTLAQDGWFGEGDDFFYIDGEKVPSLQGTGSEDYFNDAWGFRPRTGNWFGQPRWQGDMAGDSGVCYRWHLPDAVQFEKSLKVTIEHKGNREESEDGFYLERPDFLSSVAFWYQTGRPKPFGELPSWSQRRVPWQEHHLVRTFRRAESTGEAKVRVDTTGFFGARPVLQWPNRSPGAVLTLPFRVAQEGRYAVRLTAADGPKLGAFEVLLDGKPAGQRDFRAAEDAEADVSLGVHSLSPGEHTIAFRAASKPEQLGPLSVEMLRLLRLPAEAKRDVRTHHEAHFVRLGIGRAVYAYRLAFDALPDSLQTLVGSGIMPARYARDENNLPLKARREGGYFIVESPAPNGWTHRWQGLDARR